MKQFTVRLTPFLAVLTIVLSFTIVLVPIRSQDNPTTLSATLFRSKDWFVVYINVTDSSRANVKLRDLQFNFQPGNTTVRLDKFEAAFGLNFDKVTVPACLRLQRDNTEGPYPSDCTSNKVRRYSVPVSNADIFWYDKENGRNFTLSIIGADSAVFDCSTSQVDCGFDVPAVRDATLVPTIPNAATALPTGNSIVLVRNHDLYVVDRYGKNERQLTNTPNISEGSPGWSHSGEYIIYDALAAGESNSKLYRMNADGTSSTRMTTGSNADWSPVYSPDDTKIVYTATVNSVNQIWEINADGSNPVNLTGSSGADNMEPDWSPEGKHIVFSSKRTGRYELWMMEPDGQNQKQISNNASGCYFPSWSPDGQFIAFMSDVGGGGYDLYTIQVGGGDGHGNRITFNPRAINSQPHWSPDSQFIVYAAKVNSRDYALFVVNREGKGDPNPITRGWEPSCGNSQ